MTQCTACDREPTLGEMLEDPIVQLVMARDGVACGDVENLMNSMTIPRAREGSQATVCIAGDRRN